MRTTSLCEAVPIVVFRNGIHSVVSKTVTIETKILGLERAKCSHVLIPLHL